jgi:hypothetical protein
MSTIFPNVSENISQFLGEAHSLPDKSIFLDPAGSSKSDGLLTNETVIRSADFTVQPAPAKPRAPAPAL